MDFDDVAAQPTRRASSAHDRPTRAPFGPRIRTRPKHSVDMPSTGPPSADDHASPTTNGPDSPAADTAPPSIAASFALSSRTDVAIQTPPPPSSPPHPFPAKTVPHKSPAGTFIAPPPLTPPPIITFESTPIPWKGLPLEAAQWTFSSSELQEIVSKAIRLSARESFVRLLSLQALEVDIVQEAERLEAERAAIQAQWRFQVGRRTMLMQALNSSVASSAPNISSGAGAGELGSDNHVAAFVGQLATSIASCDALLSSVLHFSDQQSQIELIQHQHWASALGVALRKLNRAYERQGQELKRTQLRVQTLEDELEEAWREAERIAIEFDDLEEEVRGSGSEEVDEHPEEDTDPEANAYTNGEGHDTSPSPGPDLKAMQDSDETGTLGDATINTDIAVVLGVTATAVASKATLVTSPSSPKFFDKSDTKSVRSVKSTRSRRSTRDGPSYASRVSAARTRSRTASNASLRLPKSLRSAPSIHTSSADAPPIPALPQDHSFLDMDNFAHGHDQTRKTIPPQRQPEPTFTLPTPPHSAGLPPSRVPSIWLETDGGNSTRLNGLDRTHSLQIFSSLKARTPRKSRRSNLVMSLTGSNRSSDAGMGSPTEGGASGSGSGTARTAGTASPTSNGSPVSLPTHALAHFRGPSLTSSQSEGGIEGKSTRPGSAGARLTTARDTDTRSLMPTMTPRKSLMSRASSVILRRLSQATSTRIVGGNKGAMATAGGKGASLVSPFSSPSRSREALRSSGVGVGRTLEGWREGDGEGEEGEVMLIGSPHTDLFDP